MDVVNLWVFIWQSCAILSQLAYPVAENESHYF